MSESPEPSSTPLPPSGDSGDSGPVPHLEWDAFPWHHFRGYTKSQRAGKLKSWIWSFGFDIEHQANVDNRLWVFEAPRFRRLLEYLNPSIALTQAHMTHSTIRTKLFQEYHQYKHIVIKELRERPGQIHLAFDGWRSPNRYALNGIAAFYLSKEKRPQKIILGLPELRESHTGENIASQVAEVIESFEIQDKIGYFTLDNAKNNDTAVAALGHVFNFEGKQRRVRCFGHIINLVAKALLFGKDNEVFKSEERLDLDLARHDLWRKRGAYWQAPQPCPLDSSIG
ncbi:restless-like transposase [Hirsutella rhossiliensis]